MAGSGRGVSQTVPKTAASSSSTSKDKNKVEEPIASVDVFFPKTSDELNVALWTLEMITGDQDFDSLISSFSFSGFDPTVTFRKMVRIIKEEPSAKKDLVILLGFGLTRGFGGKKTRANIIERTKAEGRPLLTAAFEKFDVQFKPAKDLRPSDITVSRAMIAFPLLTYRIHLKIYEFKMPDFMGTKLPLGLCYPGSAAVVRPEEYEDLKEELISYSINCSSLWKNAQTRDEAEKFVSLAYHNPLSLVNLRPSFKVIERTNDDE